LSHPQSISLASSLLWWGQEEGSWWAECSLRLTSAHGQWLTLLGRFSDFSTEAIPSVRERECPTRRPQSGEGVVVSDKGPQEAHHTL
jgi:hypothetical protein